MNVPSRTLHPAYVWYHRAQASKVLGKNKLLSSSPTTRLCCQTTEVCRRLKTEAVYATSLAPQLLSLSVFLLILVLLSLSVSLSLSLLLCFCCCCCCCFCYCLFVCLFVCFFFVCFFFGGGCCCLGFFVVVVVCLLVCLLACSFVLLVQKMKESVSPTSQHQTHG